MGRPRTQEPRKRQLNLSLTDSELAAIEQRAKAVGMRPVHFGRAVLLDERGRFTRRTDPAGHLHGLIYTQLARLGNNLNQLMRRLHQTGEPVPADLEPLLRDIRQLIARVPQATAREGAVPR